MISEKLDLLMLGKDERIKAENKFLATLALITKEELQEVLEYLSSEGVHITKAKDIKVLGNSKDEIAKKFSVINEIREDIYKQDPSKINCNVIDVYKRIQSCKLAGMNYRKEDGTYEAFLFDEVLWQQASSKVNAPLDISPVVAPVEELDTFNIDSIGIQEDNVVNLEDFNRVDNDMESLDAHTTNFATIKEELEGQLRELDNLKDEVINFNDLEPDNYGMGRGV